MPAILFGSISTVADTSEMQREAFNRAFEEHGLGWHWGRDQYLDMLRSNGGQDRIAEYGRSVGQDVDASAVHRSKSEHFRHLITGSGLTPRPGVADTVRDAHAAGLRVGLVTSTSPENVAALTAALDGSLDGGFDLTLSTDDVGRVKPDAQAYTVALDRLGERARDCVAVEDNVGGVASATAAGVTCVAFPNQNTAGHDFAGARTRVDRVDFAGLRELITNH